MKLTVLQEELVKAISIASRFTTPKVQLPILANIMLDATKNSLHVSATNLEISVNASVGASVEVTGSITIPARTLLDIVSNLPKGHITFETTADTVTISAKGFNGKITGMAGADFPSIPNEIGKNPIALKTSDLSDALSRVLYAVSVDESRPILTGVLFLVSSGHLRLVSTDGFRLSEVTLLADTEQNEKFIVPKAILSELIRLKEEYEEIAISYSKDENQLVCAIGKTIVSSRLIEGEFPDFEKIIPKSPTLRTIIGTNDFLRAVKLALVFAKDSANVLKLVINDKSVDISAESTQKGNQVTTIEAEISESKSAESTPLALNANFLQDFLQSVNGEEISLEAFDPRFPAVIFKDVSDSTSLHIIMPIKLQG